MNLDQDPGTTPANLVARYQQDLRGTAGAILIRYRLLHSETGPDSETCVHVAFDPELAEVVIYEEW